MSTTIAAFSVSGEFLTEFSRTRVLEDRWDHAIKVLECLEGISLDQIISVLKGDAKLTGDSSSEDIELEDDDDQEYKKKLLFMFGGVWNNAGRYMRPYACVTSWGPDAMIEDDRFSSRKSRWRHRSEYYANSHDDICISLKYQSDDFKENDILFKEVSNFPHLIISAASVTNPQEALDEYVTIRGALEERGYLGGRSRINYLDEVTDSYVTSDPVTAKIPVEKVFKISPRDSSPLSGALDLLNSAYKAQDNFENNRSRYVTEILKQAGDNFIKIDVAGKELSIPQAPFENWCLWRGDGAHLAMPWNQVCPSGLKMMGDDPYHTDFMVGAGLDLDAMKDHNSPLHKAIWDLRAKVQKEKCGFKCAVLCGTGKSSTLRVVQPKKGQECKADEVAVIPNAGPDYVAAAMTAGAVITEKGGAMAHLVTVSREKDIKILRVEKARKLYPVGMHLVVDCSKGDVYVPYDRQDYKMQIGGTIIDVDTLK